MEYLKLSLAVFLIISLLSLLFLAWEASHAPTLAPEDDPDLPAYPLDKGLSMNIYHIKINDTPSWLQAADNLPEAVQLIMQDILDNPGDSDFEELTGRLTLTIEVKLVALNMDLDDFEQNHPEELDAYF